MKGSQRYLGETTGGYTGRSGIRSIPLQWREEWFTTVCLMIGLAVMVFLMLLSIYLVVTKPEPSSVPGDNGGRPLQDIHADKFAAVPGDIGTGPALDKVIRTGSA